MNNKGKTGRDIREARRQLDMSQQDIATALGMHVRSISRLETRDAKLSRLASRAFDAFLLRMKKQKKLQI